MEIADLIKIRTILAKYAEEKKIKFIGGLKISEDFKIYPKFIDETLEKYPELNTDDFHGITWIGCTDDKKAVWQQHGKGVRVLEKEFVYVIRMELKMDIGLPDAGIIHTFLHELTHTVTLPRKQTASLDKKTSGLQLHVKRGGKYQVVHHHDDFYRNLATMFRLADACGIYQLPKQYRKFGNLAIIKRFDALINPHDKLSLGTVGYKK